MKNFLKTFIILFVVNVTSQDKKEVKSLVMDFPGNGAVTAAPDGNLLVNEYGIANSDLMGTGENIFLVRPNGEYSVFLKDLKGPIGGVFDNQGTFYFHNASSYKNSDLMCYKNGKLSKVASIPGFAADLLWEEKTSQLIVTNYTESVLYKVNTKGSVKEYIKDDRLKGCTGITLGKDGSIFVSNFSSGKIYRINKDEKLEEFAAIPVEYPGYVIGYITFFEGNLYATGYGASRIYKINSEGVVSILAGSGKRKEIDGNANEASFHVPNGIDVDRVNKRLYISQNGNGRPAALRYIEL